MRKLKNNFNFSILYLIKVNNRKNIIKIISHLNDCLTVVFLIYLIMLQVNYKNS
jgi:hypothetical protein